MKSGLGIGLALVRNLVGSHGGSVTAASAGLGQGSEFTGGPLPGTIGWRARGAAHAPFGWRQDQLGLPASP